MTTVNGAAGVARSPVAAEGEAKPKPKQGQGQGQGRSRSKAKAEAKAKVEAKIEAKIKAKVKAKVKAKIKAKIKANARSRATTKPQPSHKHRPKTATPRLLFNERSIAAQETCQAAVNSEVSVMTAAARRDGARP